jgi:hypothetical protein
MPTRVRIIGLHPLPTPKFEIEETPNLGKGENIISRKRKRQALGDVS